MTIKEYSETLIHQLALRDELEYEKELKNQFISLLLSIQKKRRETQLDKKRGGGVAAAMGGAGLNPKRLRGAGPPEPGTVSNTSWTCAPGMLFRLLDGDLTLTQTGSSDPYLFARKTWQLLNNK